MGIAKHGAGIAARSNRRTPWAAATLLGLAWAGNAHALTALAPAMLKSTACFHKDQGFIARAQLDFSSENADGLFDVYKGAHYQGQWAFQNTQGQWVVLPPSIGVVPIAGSAIRHPQRTLGAGVNALDVGIAEPALRTPGMLPGLTVFMGYGASGPQSFADLLARQRFGVVAQLVGNESLRDNCDTPSPAPGAGGGGGTAPTPAPGPAPAPAADTTPPSTPTALTATAASSTSAQLQWAASTDNVAVTSYRVYRNGSQVATATTTQFTVTGLSASTSYTFHVVAVDAAGNQSGSSASATANTPGALSITQASLDATSVTVTGNGFGTKANAAPLKFEDFDSVATGAVPSTFGYRNYGGFGGSTTVDDSTAFSGTKSLLHQGHFGPVSGNDVEESFPHIAVTGFSSQTLYLSYRIKFNVNGGRLTQLKFNRSGMDVGGDCYGGSPKFYSSYYPEAPSGKRYDADKTLSGGVQGGILRRDGTRDEGWVGEASMGSGTAIPLQENVWYQVEEY